MVVRYDFGGVANSVNPSFLTKNEKYANHTESKIVMESRKCSKGFEGQDSVPVRNYELEMN